MAKSQFSTDLHISKRPLAPTERIVLGVYHEALVQIVVSKLETHFTNPFGDIRERTPPACPMCQEIGFGLIDRDAWLWCDSGECDFRLSKDSYLSAIKYFDSDQYDIDLLIEEVPILPLS